LQEYILDGNYIRFALFATIPMLFCVGLVRPSASFCDHSLNSFQSFLHCRLSKTSPWRTIILCSSAVSQLILTDLVPSHTITKIQSTILLSAPSQIRSSTTISLISQSRCLSTRRVFRPFCPYTYAVRCMRPAQIYILRSPSIESLKRAMQTYARQGGTSSIFVNDDGLRVCLIIPPVSLQ
jgi:hypothetical protein